MDIPSDTQLSDLDALYKPYKLFLKKFFDFDFSIRNEVWIDINESNEDS